MYFITRSLIKQSLVPLFRLNLKFEIMINLINLIRLFSLHGIVFLYKCKTVLLIAVFGLNNVKFTKFVFLIIIFIFIYSSLYEFLFLNNLSHLIFLRF